MTFNKKFLNFATVRAGTTSALFTLALLMSACGAGTPAATDTAAIPPPIPLVNGTSLTAQNGTNVLRMSVSAGPDCVINYINKPCVTITLCTAGTATCSTINDVLLDTGSYGLRLFQAALGNAVPTQVVAPNGNNLAECIQYGDGSKQWGPVKTAKLQMGGEPAIDNLPIQVIDSTFAGTGLPPVCSGAVATVAAGQFNGILGVGLFDKDCGTSCVNGTSGQYFSCTGGSGVNGTCVGSVAPLVSQVRNPVAALSADTGGIIDNNGVVLELPDLAFGGAVSTSGYVIFGIGTRANNTPSNTVAAYTADASYGEFKTTSAGHTYSSFIDSGSNSLSFPSTNTGLPICSNYPSWYCPTSNVTLSAVNTANSGGATSTIGFQLEAFSTFWASPNYVAKEIGNASGANIASMFDWGLPFFYGRNTYVAISGKSTTLGNGPYWAY
jgi:hypothetical protein